MKIKKNIYFLMSFILISINSSHFLQLSFADIPDRVKQFLTWEYNSNSAGNSSQRGEQQFTCSFYEIPLTLVSSLYELNTPQHVKDTLIFNKKNAMGKMESHVRWLINPEDTKFHLEVKKFLQKNGYDDSAHDYYDCYKTSSRSIIVHNPETNSTFSIKASTDNTGGSWKDKKVDSYQVLDSQLTNRFVQKSMKQFEFDHLILAPEPMGLTLKDDSAQLDQGFIVRTYEEMVQGESYFIPGFAALHEDAGRILAKQNGFQDPVDFWGLNYAKSLGQANAELAAFNGITLTSAHSQQYLIELKREPINKVLKPTGRILIRDFTDSHLYRPFFNPENTEESELMKHFSHDPEEGNCVVNNFESIFGILHGMKAPSWITINDYQNLKDLFFLAYENKFKSLTGISLENHSNLARTNNPTSFSYWRKEYSKTQEWNDYLAIKECFKGEIFTKDGFECEDALKQFYKKYELHEKSKITKRKLEDAFQAPDDDLRNVKAKF